VSRDKTARANDINHVIETLKRYLVQGHGIEIRRAGDRAVISVARQPIAPGGRTSQQPQGKGRSNCPTVETLPAVPTTSETFQRVFWTSDGDGTGDNGVWWTRTGLTRWYPMIYSTKDGAPGEEELA
jgi:hypothetical protein